MSWYIMWFKMKWYIISICSTAGVEIFRFNLPSILFFPGYCTQWPKYSVYKCLVSGESTLSHRWQSTDHWILIKVLMFRYILTSIFQHWNSSISLCTFILWHFMISLETIRKKKLFIHTSDPEIDSLSKQKHELIGWWDCESHILGL